MENILVSIHCTTYNHEKYIEDAIESFLMQQTNFKYEIIIHDDASTDSTADIIRAYQRKYPDIIKPILQKENQRSKGVSVTKLNMKRAKGKYIAFCEGDDYWTHPQKLQKQVDYMENNPDCSLCVHAGYIVFSLDKKLVSYNRPNKGNNVFTVEEVIEGGGGLFLTNTILFSTKFSQNRPAFFDVSPVGDYPLVINLSLPGTVHYIDEYMSAYRVGVGGSWTANYLSTIEKKKTHFEEIAIMLDEINKYTNYQYEDTITRTKSRNQFNLLLEQRLFKEAKTGEFRELYTKLGVKRKIIIFINQYYPRVADYLKLIKRKWFIWAMK